MHHHRSSEKHEKQKLSQAYDLREFFRTRSGNKELNPYTTIIKHNTLITIFINVNLLHCIVYLWCNIAIQWCKFRIFAPH